jgi:prepilin-type N-terminal cleavage/methylation domain-containing protein
MNKITIKGSKHVLLERGDTLVEVLISMAIIAAILGGAFVTTNDSRLGIDDSREHAAGLLLAQNQLEFLRTIASTDSSSLSSAPAQFCIFNQNQIVNASSSNCSVDSTGTPATTQPVYNLSVSLDSSTNIYTASVAWPSLLNGKDNVQLVYRLNASDSSDPGGGSGPTGGAGIGSAPCDPSDPTCDDGPSPGGSYDWSDEFQNTSPSGQAVLGCSWDWGDGTVTTNVFCNSGDIIDHTFVSKPTPDPYPADCQIYPYTVTLTEHLANGLNPTDTYHDDLPTCD